ncbi:hypothetical protein MHM582_1810 [Microbacterium sp. HM58-2]|nr:hypothetical protein MHM582_1810 [Microbacterium sp. HM58-2]
MAVVQAPPLAAEPRPVPAGRDVVIDLVRALCVTGVVLLHAIMVGVTITDAGPVFANASEGAWWIIPVSWMLQVMPLFFVIGGFSGLLALRRLRARGGSSSGFIAGRVQRLLGPSLVAVGVVGALQAMLLLGGIDPALVAVASFRYSQPLWFLAVYLLAQSLLPLLIAAHDRMPLRTIAGLAAAALAVDALRAVTRTEGLGYLNLAFVWLALQQAGFFLADGRVDSLSRRTRAVAGLAAIAMLALGVAGGLWSPDLVASTNPPTGALLLVGIAHLAAVSLFRAPIARLARRPRIAAFSAFVNARTMTIYLWHMPVLLTMAGTSAVFALVTGLGLPAPGGVEWWLGRPLWLAVALALTALAALAFARFESQPVRDATRAPRRLLGAVLTGGGSVVLLLVFGTTVWTALIAVLAMSAALRLAREQEPVSRRGRASGPAARSARWPARGRRGCAPCA